LQMAERPGSPASKKRKVESGGIKVVILVGGPSKGTRFRPLSLEKPKPLFPVAGKPLISHHIKACAGLSGLREVLLLGFFDEDKEWQAFLQSSANELQVPVRYLKESHRWGTAGGLNGFRKEILEGNPEGFFVIHCDIVSSFPLAEILGFHKQHGKECTIMGKKVPKEEAHKYGCLAVDPATNEVLHYAEKPETFVSDIINCGVYLFSPRIFELFDKGAAMRDLTTHPPHQHAHEKVQPTSEEPDPHFLRLEQDIFPNICGEKHVYFFETKDFWLQIKNAATVVKASEALLHRMRAIQSPLLSRHVNGGPQIEGDVLIDPSAKIHPSAKIGPNVSIGANVTIGAGVRVSHSLILDNVDIKERACIMHCIVGWNCTIGKWARLEGVPNHKNNGKENGGLTILGTGVTVAPEIIVRECVVLPHKDLSGNFFNQVLL